MKSYQIYIPILDLSPNSRLISTSTWMFNGQRSSVQIRPVDSVSQASLLGPVPFLSTKARLCRPLGILSYSLGPYLLYQETLPVYLKSLHSVLVCLCTVHPYENISTKKPETSHLATVGAQSIFFETVCLYTRMGVPEYSRPRGSGQDGPSLQPVRACQTPQEGPHVLPPWPPASRKSPRGRELWLWIAQSPNEWTDRWVTFNSLLGLHGSENMQHGRWSVTLC